MFGGNVDAFWGELAPCDHLLQIYEQDAALLDALAGFVAGGLAAGEAAIVIATEAHRTALEQRLAAVEVDLGQAIGAERYLAFDAADSLAQFIVADWPDEERFTRWASGLLRRARGPGRRVRAFGEMVALLWGGGNAAATVRLEHLWNKLCRSERFSLFCAYPAIGLTQELSKSIGDICAAHSHILAVA